jgi:colicin import membrane protein
MKRFTFFLPLFPRKGLLLMACCSWALANPLSPQAERDRIAKARVQVQAIHDKNLSQCKNAFAVTDCEQRVAKTRRAQLDQLNREELVLKDQERKRKAAKQLKKLDDRAKRRETVGTQQGSPERQQKIKLAKPQTVSAQSESSEHADAEKLSEAKYQVKLRAAQAHQNKVQQSGSLRVKPGASSLPVPK